MTSRLDAIDWPVRTARTSFRPVTVPDLGAMWRYRGDPDVVRWMTTPAEPRAEFVERMSQDSVMEKTLVLLVDDEVAGDLFLAFEDAWAQTDVREHAQGTQAEIGWCLDPRSAGHGYARESVRRLVDLCFGDLGLRRLVANCFAANEPSWRLMEAIGMRREAHTVKDSLHRELGWLDGYTYALLAEEWDR